ncbi:MAG: nitrogen fixation protein NifQ [Gammaproteobacteria bacterium]
MLRLQSLQGDRERIYRTLQPDRPENPNCDWLAKIIASWLCGKSVLPDYLGLEPEQFQTLLDTQYPGFDVPFKAPSGIVLDFERMLEREDLIKLLQLFRSDASRENDVIIGLIVSACLGSDHLWQDLGLWNRSELTALLRYNFPALAERNVKDMKWKKFLYKQLCEAEGLYLCRAPSCEVCKDYSDCFGSEE